VSAQPLPMRFRLSLRRRPGTLGSAWRQPLAIVGMVLAVAWILVAIFAPLIAPYDPLAQTSHLTLAPSPAHLFGTDELGRDVFSRVLWGSRLSLPLAFILVAAAVTVGGALGGLFRDQERGSLEVRAPAGSVSCCADRIVLLAQEILLCHSPTA